MSRVKELYKIIQDAEEELADIRENCPHTSSTEGNYMSRPGRIDAGYICDYCGEYLGELKTAIEWIKNPQWMLGDDRRQQENYLLSSEYSDDKISWQQFVKLVDYNNLVENTKKWLKAKNRDKQIDSIIKDESKS